VVRCQQRSSGERRQGRLHGAHATTIALGMPAVGYAPLLALLPRRVSDDEIGLIISKLMPGRRSVDNVDVGVEITRVTDEMPSSDDIERVQRRCTAIGWPGGHPDKPKA
jgi:Protein of unknown function (DUF3349)